MSLYTVFVVGPNEYLVVHLTYRRVTWVVRSQAGIKQFSDDLYSSIFLFLFSINPEADFRFHIRNIFGFCCSITQILLKRAADISMYSRIA